METLKSEPDDTKEEEANVIANVQERRAVIIQICVLVSCVNLFKPRLCCYLLHFQRHVGHGWFLQ